MNHFHARRLMTYELQVVVEPTAEPVTLAEAKAHLRVLHSTEDALIQRFLNVARAHVETLTGRAIITRQLKLVRDGFAGRMPLPRPPLISVTSVTYLDTAGAEQTLPTSVYEVTKAELGGEITCAAGSVWPETINRRRTVAILFSAGYGVAPASVPEDLRNALLLLTEHYYYNRSAVSDGPLSATPMAVDSLLAPYMTTGWI